MKVIINKDASIRELAEILVNLRRVSKVWREHYGAQNRVNMEYWERKADKWIENNIKDTNDRLPEMPDSRLLPY